LERAPWSDLAVMPRRSGFQRRGLLRPPVQNPNSKREWKGGEHGRKEISLQFASVQI
jgi:hypothetical protein